jgi:hypothetical protein
MIMIYDIAAKVVIDTSKEAILRRFLEIELESVELIEELPQEIVSLKRRQRNDIDSTR